MELIGTIITYIIMAYCVVGGVSYIIDDQSELGQSFNDGLHAMANLFIPICGLMASVPFLTVFIPKYIGPSSTWWAPILFWPPPSSWRRTAVPLPWQRKSARPRTCFP